MVQHAILVNGIPASGKSSLAAELAEAAGATMISLDTVLESLADAAEYRFPREPLQQLANDTSWRLAGIVDELVVLESFWSRDRDREGVEEGIAAAGIRSVVEVWCDAPVDEAVQRYEERDRHGIHEEDPHDTDVWERAEPLALGPVVRVDTSASAGKADPAQLWEKVRAELG
jgi:glucokinase